MSWNLPQQKRDRRIGHDLGAAVLGYLTRTALLGREFPFSLSYVPEPMSLGGVLLVAPLMGLAAAPAGHVFIRMMTLLKRLLGSERSTVVRVALGGLLVAASASSTRK